MANVFDSRFDAVFAMEDDSAWQGWRRRKRESWSSERAGQIVELDDPFAPAEEVLNRLKYNCERFNLAFYRVAPEHAANKALVTALGERLGLSRLDANLRSDEDAVSSLCVRAQQGNQYIPYTNKALSWHTDGYYNASDKQIYAIVMHCATPAAQGGENLLLDHEWMYMRLREIEPAYVRALMHPRAMTIPANIEDGREIRPAVSGPVFSLHAGSGRLHMRYSARKRNIIWRDDAATREAADCIRTLLDESPAVIRLRLGEGEGVVSNNVLHNRTAFEDSPARKRLLYRARYYDRVS